jgi:hypothetical protein
MTGTTTDPTTDIITAAHRRALRNADSVSFHLLDGQAFITAHLARENSRTGFDQSVDIMCGAARVTDYTRDHTSVPFDESHRYVGFQYGSHPAYNDVLRTLLDRIRVGCTLELHWLRNNNSESHTRVGYAHDELHLRIMPPHGKGRVEVYKVDEFFGPDNTARMVRVK